MTRFEELYLKPHKFMAQHSISEDLVRSMHDNIEMQSHHDYGFMTIQVILRALGTDPDETKVTFPENWWEAVKERWFQVLVSLKVLKPVLYRTVTVSKFAIYPELPAQRGRTTIVIPKLQRHESVNFAAPAYPAPEDY